MKKKLSLLLAVVFVMTLAFGILPTAGAEQAPDHETDPPAGYHWECTDIEATYETEPSCGLEEHKSHGSECYELICETAEHTHSDECQPTERTCGKTPHQHWRGGLWDDDCYNWRGELTCNKEEHTHNDSCNTTTICNITEHTHSGFDGECYNLTCPITELHTHSIEEGCYALIPAQHTCKLERDKGTVELTVTYGDSRNVKDDTKVTLTDIDGNTYNAFTNSGVAVFTGVNTGAVTFSSISYTSYYHTYTGTPSSVILHDDGDTARASVNLSLILTGSADHIDLRMQNASITVNTKIVEAGNPSNVLSTTSSPTTGSVIGVTNAVITWNDNTTREITGFEPRDGYENYEYTRGFGRRENKIDNIQNIKSVVFTIKLKDADNNEYDNVVVSYDQAGVQLAAKSCEGSNGGTQLSGIDFDVETVTDLIIEKTISTNKIIKVTKDWDDKGLVLTHPAVDITVTQTCGETTLSDTKTLASGSTELMFDFLELDDMTYTYTVSEAAVSGYIVSGGAVTAVDPDGGFNYQYEATLTNTYDISEETTSFVGTKVWSDSEEIEHNNADLILTLYADGIAVQATPAWDGNMFYFHELPMYKETNDGLVAIVYTVVETPPQNYRASYGEGNYCENGGTITNTYFESDNPPIDNPIITTVTVDTANLTITKTVSGDVDEAPDSSFDFTVTFTPGAPDYWNLSGINAPAGASGSDGTYTFSLKADQSITFRNVPVGTTYVVTETTVLADGWSAGTATDASGSIGANGAIATIDNVYTAPEQGVAGDVTKEPPSDDGSASEDGQQVAGDVDTLPQTGGISPSTLLGIFGLALITIGGAAFTILRRKNDGKSKSKSK